MFKDNKYTRWYFSIIDNAKEQNRAKGGDVYYESHHVIPRCMGGSNHKENLVLLTAKEHLMCHAFLVRMTEGIFKGKMSRSLHAMRMTNKFQGKRITSRIFELNRALFSKTMSDLRKGKPGNIPSKEGIERLRKSKLGKPRPPHIIELLSKIHKGKSISTAHREAISRKMSGKVVSAETKRKMSLARQAYWERKKNGSYS